MTYALITLYSLFFTYITWRRFEHGLFLFFLLLPTYLIRFTIFGIPTTLLEVMFLILCFTFVSSKVKQNKIEEFTAWFRVIKMNKLLTTSIVLFLLGATISIFTSVDIRTALGEWKAFYVEPVILFLILTQYTLKKEETQSQTSTNYSLPITHYILFPLLLCGFITSLLAIYQHFTGWMVPHAFWANRETYRVTAWYGFPNGVGLFLAPLVPLAIDMLVSHIHNIKKEPMIIPMVSLLFLLTSLPAILFAKSTGAIIGIAAGIGCLLLIYKKTRWFTLTIVIFGLISLLTVPNLRPIRDEILFQDRSGQIRLSIYNETFELLKDRPILGAGLASYDERIAPYHGRVNGESIEIYHHPHNIFLTIWVNTGLIGLIGFLGIIVWCFKKSYEVMKLPAYRTGRQSDEVTKNYQLPITNYITTSLIVLLVAGLVDSPYIKNDLAFLFWTIIALIYISTQKQKTTSSISSYHSHQ